MCTTIVSVKQDFSHNNNNTDIGNNKMLYDAFMEIAGSIKDNINRSHDLLLHPSN